MAERITLNVSDETKKLFYDLSEQPEVKSKEDFLNRLLVLYQAEQVKESVSLLKPAIEACQELNARMLEVLTGAAAMQATAEEKHIRALDEQKTSFEETRSLLQQRIAYMEQSTAEAEKRANLLNAERENAESKAAELLQQIGRLESAIADKSALVDEYKSKNDSLTGLVAEFQKAAAENKDLSESINQYKQDNGKLQQQIADMHREKERQAGTHTTEMGNLRTSLQLEKDAAILELRQKLQAEAEERQAKYAAQIAEYQARIENMLTDRERAAAEPTPPPGEPAAKKPRKTFKADAANIDQFFSGPEPQAEK